MSHCAECVRLRKLLSPLEDAGFTAIYLAAEPREWIDTQRATRMGHAHVRVKLVDLWQHTFPDSPHTALGLTKLGRTLQALGWSRTKIDGLLYFTMRVDDWQA